ncbi:MAG: discoidin domain-containing protein, partial [Lentisphaeria bacterium]|nr:discoidin domain-containing protein [Lentisphaeria bacterium]
FSAFDQGAWTWNRCNPDVVNDALRLQVLPGAAGNYATFHATVPAAPAEAFLQVQMGEMENASAKPWVRNASSNGAPFGHLFVGWNTFSMYQNAGRNFALSLGQLGSGQETGPWVDYRQVRIVRRPVNGLVVTVQGKKPGEAVQVGDRLLFQYHAETGLGDASLEVDCFLYPQMVEYRCQASGPIVLKSGGDGGGALVYSAEAVIDEQALSVGAEDQAALMAAVHVHGSYSYFTLPYRLDIKTAQVIPAALVDAGNLQTRKDRQLWFDLTRGDNLALGKRVLLVPAPDYRLTTDENDGLDLTDGKLTRRSDDKVWFDRQAVGWYSGNGEAFLKLDLGKTEKLDRLVIRCLGGTVGNFQFPRSFDAYVSRDGQTYHLARTMQKLMPGESDQSDFVHNYYVEEQGSVYSTRMYPFQIGLQAEARCVLLKITGTSGSIFTDELAVIEATTTGPDFNAAYQSPGEEIPLEGLLVRTRLGTLDLIRDIPAPQTFSILDLRAGSAVGQDASVVFDLPPGVTVRSPELTSEPLMQDGHRYQRFVLPITLRAKKLVSPSVFLAVEAGCQGDLPAYCMGRSGGEDQYRSRLPLQIVSLPPIPRFQRLHVSLSWMSTGSGLAWPDFLDQWEKLGFNTVSAFPRFWKVNDYQEQRALVDAARQRGYKIIMNDSAFHEMMRGHKEGSELFCDIPGKSHKMLCPSYRGQFYVKEMERVARCVKMGVPDYVYYDIECWGKMNQSAPQCRRCQEALRKSGKSLEEFLLDCRVEQMRDLDAAVRRAAAEIGLPVPVQGDYNRDAVRSGEFFQRIYPQYINMAMPSLYVAGRAVDVHKRIRGNYQMLRAKNQVPWLSTGTYGEFEPYKVEMMVLETLLNGANGVTYYSYGDFTDSPHDFFYHARALAMLRPYEDLIMDGEVLEPSGANDLMFYSGIRQDRQMLLLVGNYYKADEATAFTFPWAGLDTVVDLQTGQAVSAQTVFAFEVPKGGFRLFYARGK